MVEPTPPGHKSPRGAAWAVAAGTFVLLVATGPSLSIVWDEGYTLGRLERMRHWFRAVADPPRFAATMRPPGLEMVLDGMTPPRARDLDTRAKLFDPKVIAWFWPFAREEPHGHPPFYAIVGLIGDIIAPFADELTRARLGPMLAFSLAAGALYSFLAKRHGAWAAAVGAGAWVAQPRLFAHAHYASYDALLTSLWVGSILAFAEAIEPRGKRPSWRPRWGWAIAFGVLAGWTAGTKLTGWFLPIPFLVWTALDRNRRGAVTLLVGGVVGLATLYVFTPPWWNDPVGGVERFFHSNLTREHTIPITVQFLGQVYRTPRESLPWYNTLVWTVFITPVGFLLFALGGLVRACRRARSEPFGLLAAGHWLFLLTLRALPHTPGHDGERQFLPAFGCLALVAGLGAASFLERFGRRARWFVAAALAEGALSIALMMPVPLSYYSPVVGGLPGATAIGMEPTYYWDALDDATLDWLKTHTGPGQKIEFATYPTSWIYLQRIGRLRMALDPDAPGEFAWYVVQNRSGDLSTRDVVLIQVGRYERVVKKWGVPLIWVFPYSEVRACDLAEQRQKEGP